MRPGITFPFDPGFFLFFVFLFVTFEILRDTLVARNPGKAQADPDRMWRDRSSRVITATGTRRSITRYWYQFGESRGSVHIPSGSSGRVFAWASFRANRHRWPTP
ncbi:hypothetical protein Zmor_023840 [Zophobas morio]|uniref:Uncharacterized protein n=1 Tax=Zophobas morio TaxID=2755281 RepID=A0AA38HZ24_9CUCU|nr:hypothetical protein Zmor_023840 [Zophobas morio]